MHDRRLTRLLTAFVVLAFTIPLTASVASGRQGGQPEAAHWRTIANQGFESTFPTDHWSANDYNGPTGGQGPGYEWDDTAVRSATGMWSASPSDGNNPYPPLLDTWLRYGPFSLAGASDARVLFRYWLDTEISFDFFGWAYSCDGINGWHETTVSGSHPSWTDGTMSLRPCRGSTNVWIRFSFKSDAATEAQGPYLDDVRVQKFS